MVTGVGDEGTDVPMLVIDQRPTVGGRRVCTLDSELPTSVFCPISEEVVDDEEQEKDSGNEMDLVPERQVYDSKTGIDIPRDKELDCRNAELKESMNHHVFDEIRSEAVGKKLIRARWLNDDRGEKARERLVPMEIAAFEEKRDDNHAMTPPLKVARMLISRAATGSTSRRRVLGIHDIQVAFFHAPVVDGHVALLRRAFYCGRQANWL